jgi:hypothetical protein
MEAYRKRQKMEMRRLKEARKEKEERKKLQLENYKAWLENANSKFRRV